MVSLVPLLPTAPAPTPLPRPSKALLRRATLSGIIRTSDDADLNDDLLSAPPSPSKRAKVTFNPNVEEKVMEEYTVRGRTLDSIRAEVRRSIEAHQRGDSDGYDVLKEVFLPRKDREPEAEPELLRLEIKTYLLALTNCVSLLKGCSGLVKAILACDWMGRDASFVKAYIYFLGNLVSAQGVYMGSVLAMLVGHFHGGRLYVFCCMALANTKNSIILERPSARLPYCQPQPALIEGTCGVETSSQHCSLSERYPVTTSLLQVSICR